MTRSTTKAETAVLGLAAALTVACSLLLSPWIAVAASTAALALVLVWGRPPRGLLAVVALLPFDGLLLIAPLPEEAVAWKEVLLGLTVLAALQPRWGRPAPPPAWALPLAGLLSVALVSAAVVDPLQAVVGLKVTFFGMLTALVVWRCPLTAAERERLLAILAVTGVVVAVVGLGQQVVGPERLNELGYAYNSTIRFTGGTLRSFSTFNQPFPFAFFLMLVLLVVGSVALADPGRLRHRLFLMSVPLLLAGMAVALVRTAWIGVAAGAVYLALTRHRRLLIATPLALGAVALALAVGLAGFFASASVGERFSRWEQVPDVVSTAPLGEGIGSAGAAAARTEELQGGTATYDPERLTGSRLVFQPDNSYLKVLYELGVLGLGLFVATLVALFASSRRSEQDPALGDVAAGTSALVVAGAVASVAATLFEVFPFDYLFWLVLAVATLPAARDSWAGADGVSTERTTSAIRRAKTSSRKPPA